MVTSLVVRLVKWIPPTFGLLTVGGIGSSVALGAPAYTFSTFIGGPDSIGAVALGMNDLDQVVGFYTVPVAAQVPYLKTGDVFSRTDNLEGTGLARGIDNYGRIVGSIGEQGFLVDRGRVTHYAPPNCFYINPQKINDSGVIVGGYIDRTTGSHGFAKIESAFQIVDAPFPNVLYTYAIHDINQRGQMVGTFAIRSGGFGGFLKDGDTFTEIRFPGAEYTTVSGINDAGQIAGSYNLEGEGNTIAHGFVKTGDVYTTVDLYATTGLADINNLGQVLGSSYGPGHPQAGFIGTPLPEPSAGLAVVSAVGVSTLRRRRE